MYISGAVSGFRGQEGRSYCRGPNPCSAVQNMALRRQATDNTANNRQTEREFSWPSSRAFAQGAVIVSRGSEPKCMNFAGMTKQMSKRSLYHTHRSHRSRHQHESHMISAANSLLAAVTISFTRRVTVICAFNDTRPWRPDPQSRERPDFHRLPTSEALRRGDRPPAGKGKRRHRPITATRRATSTRGRCTERQAGTWSDHPACARTPASPVTRPTA